MSNRAIHQLQQVQDSDASDVLHLAREITPGAWVDRKIERETLVQQVFSRATLISSSQVLTLNATPVELVPAMGTGKAIVPKFATIEFDSGTTDYTTNTDLVIGPTSTVNGTNYMLKGPISDASAPVIAYGVGTIAQITSAAFNDGLSATVLTGDPAAGDYDLVITVYYNIVDAG